MLHTSNDYHSSICQNSETEVDFKNGADQNNLGKIFTFMSSQKKANDLLGSSGFFQNKSGNLQNNC